MFLPNMLICLLLYSFSNSMSCTSGQWTINESSLKANLPQQSRSGLVCWRGLGWKWCCWSAIKVQSGTVLISWFLLCYLIFLHPDSVYQSNIPCSFSWQKLADLSTSPSPRLIDGILLTKFDTIDDKARVTKNSQFFSSFKLFVLFTN